MSIERELLEKVISGDNKGDFFVSYDLYKKIYELLAHPESTQEPEAWILEDKKTGYRRQSAYKPTDLDEEACNVIPLYTAPPVKSEQTEQEPVAWMYDHQIEVGYDKYTEVNIIETCARNLESNNCINIRPLYLAPPKREPLSDKEITKNTPKLIHIGERLAFHAGVRFAEKHHGIGGEDE